MEESVKKERQNVVEITETYEHLKKKAGEQEKEIQLLEDASRRNVEMEHSLQDIAKLVEDEVDEVDLAIEKHQLLVLSLDSPTRLIQKLKTPQPKRIFVGTLCPVLFLTATTNQLDLIGPEWNGKKMGGT